MKLSQLIKAWDILHVMDVGEVDFCDIDNALTQAGVIIKNDISSCQPILQQTPVGKAMNIIKQAMIDDSPSQPGSYAHSWHCNIAMMCYDAIRAAEEKNPGATADDTQAHIDAHKVGNDAASRFMKLCFDVETKA